MEKYVGTYQLGYQDVQLFVDPDSNGGSGSWNAGTSGKTGAKIVIGINCALWYSWGTLVHETVEYALTNLNASFAPASAFTSRSTDSRLFVATHKQFDEATQQSGNYIHECHKDFLKAYRKYHKNKK